MKISASFGLPFPTLAYRVYVKCVFDNFTSNVPGILHVSNSGYVNDLKGAFFMHFLYESGF